MASTADTVLLNLRQESQRSALASAGRLVLRPVFPQLYKLAAPTRLENAWSLIISPTMHQHIMVMNYSIFQTDKILVFQKF
jgi:hypothetical protein